MELWVASIWIPLHNLKSFGRSIPRNHKIANVLYYHKIFESWGRGVQMIISECTNFGHPEPFYSQDPVGILLTLPSKQLIGTAVPPDIVATLIPTQRQQEILTLLKQYKELSKEEIRTKLNQPISERWLRNELNALKAGGYINYLGSRRYRKWMLIKEVIRN